MTGPEVEDRGFDRGGLVLGGNERSEEQHPGEAAGAQPDDLGACRAVFDSAPEREIEMSYAFAPSVLVAVGDVFVGSPDPAVGGKSRALASSKRLSIFAHSAEVLLIAKCEGGPLGPPSHSR